MEARARKQAVGSRDLFCMRQFCRELETCDLRRCTGGLPTLRT